jgi:hypothetical protein
VRTDQISCAMNFIILFQYKAAPELKTQWLISVMK